VETSSRSIDGGAYVADMALHLPALRGVNDGRHQLPAERYG
jgi:hypothetical protein